MKFKLNILPNQISAPNTISAKIDNENDNFPAVFIDKDTYIVSCEVQNRLDFDTDKSAYNFQLGKYNALADGITFLINLDHDYKSVYQGDVKEFTTLDEHRKLKVKGQVIIQNDVWIGHGVTILSGVTIHNGAIIATNSVVTKDVPPYAIVAGNPARIVKYRFNENEIKQMLDISWWNWSSEKLLKHKSTFTLPINEFISKHHQTALMEINQIKSTIKPDVAQPIILFIPDFREKYSYNERVLQAYFDLGIYKKFSMLIYIPSCDNNHITELYTLLNQYEEFDAYIMIEQDVDDERKLFHVSDWYISTRVKNNVLYTDYSNLFNTKIIQASNTPIFDELEN